MTAPSTPLDPVTLEIMANGLRSVADETFAALMKSAYSTNIKERRDHSTAIMDPAGRLIVQADASLPIHLASMGGLMECLLARFDGDIRDGDLFVANDPHVAGGTHLPDINMAMPVFFDGDLIAFMCNIAHHADVGGAVPGSMAGGLTEIYQEGLRIPVVRLFREGVLQQDLLDLILLNVRVPAERRGDYFAQIASCRLGRSRLTEILGQYGIAAVRDGFGQIVTRTAARMRAAIAGLPDGVYRFEDAMDDDGMGATDIPIRLTITVDGSDIHFDFSGSAKQVTGNINVTRNATQASVCYALKALLDPDAPNNQGVLDLPRLTVEKGQPARRRLPGAGGGPGQHLPTHHRCHPGRAGAGPARSGGRRGQRRQYDGGLLRQRPAHGRRLCLSGNPGRRLRRPRRPRRQGRRAGAHHQHLEPAGRSHRDGISPARPLLRADRQFRGPGRQRGGMGLERVVVPVGHACTFNGAGERFARQPWGIFGGGAGATGEFRHVTADGETARLPNKPIGVTIAPDEAVIVRTPGAGGYGDPAERSADDLEDDLTSGKFDEAYIGEHYPQARDGGKA